jgi:hypothetical protein
MPYAPQGVKRPDDDDDDDNDDDDTPSLPISLRRILLLSAVNDYYSDWSMSVFLNLCETAAR